MSEGMKIFIFLIAYSILTNQLEKIIRNKFNIKKQKGLFKHFNKLHKWGEILFIAVIILFLIIDVLYGFILFILLFAFRAFMEWKFERESKTYILNILNFAGVSLLLIILLLFF